MHMTNIKLFLVMTIVELRQKVCWSFVFCITKVFHDMVPLLPYLHRLHQLHLSLNDKKVYCSDVSNMLIHQKKFLQFFFALVNSQRNIIISNYIWKMPVPSFIQIKDSSSSFTATIYETRLFTANSPPRNFLCTH